MVRVEDHTIEEDLGEGCAKRILHINFYNLNPTSPRKKVVSCKIVHVLFGSLSFFGVSVCLPKSIKCLMRILLRCLFGCAMA